MTVPALKQRICRHRLVGMRHRCVGLDRAYSRDLLALTDLTTAVRYLAV